MRTLLGKQWVAIDIGTTKICVLIAAQNSKGVLEVIGIGHHPSYGLKKGVVVDINRTIDSVKKAVNDAQDMAGTKVESAYVGISGGHIQSFNSHGVVAIRRREVTQGDIDRVIEAAKAIAIPKDRDVLHVLPQYFRIDGDQPIRDSLGMAGVRLEAHVHMITGAISSANNIIKCCEYAGVKVQDIVLEQLASADAVLTESERDLGVGILDIGGGTSDFAIYKNGRILHSKVIPVAGSHFTSDLAIGLRIPVDAAEQLKHKFGFVWEDRYFDLEESSVDVNLGYAGDTRAIDTYALYEILEPRAREVLEILLDEMLAFNLKPSMPFGLVLTGGGSLLSGMRDLAEDMFSMPVRIGLPQDNLNPQRGDTLPDLLKSPVYATAYGLLAFAIQNQGGTLGGEGHSRTGSTIFNRMKDWIYDFV